MAAKTFPVEASHILMFARSVGDDNRVYADADYAKTTEAGGHHRPADLRTGQRPVRSGLFPAAQARPALVRLRQEPHRDQPARPAEAAVGVAEVERGLHAEQHFEYHRHLKPGDVLTATSLPGKTWEKEGRRSGKLIFSENVTEYRDQNGELVITARGVGVRTERPVDRAIGGPHGS